jgi:predicted nucleotidyltransferase
MTRIAVDHEKIADFCRRYHVKRLSFFGSVLRDDFGPGSDVDVLVEFEPEQTPGFFELVDMEDELTAILGVSRKIDPARHST